MQKPRYEKLITYGRPHDIFYSWLVNAYAGQVAAVIPITHSDEGLGAPNTYNAHPEHPSFAEVGHSNTFQGSRVPKINGVVKLKLTGQALAAGKNHNFKVLLMRTVNPFMEQLDAKDEHTGLMLKNIIELVYESVDKQTFPAYNGTDLSARYTGSVDADSAEVSVGGTPMEQVTTDLDVLFDQLQYGTLAPLMKSLIDIRWVELSEKNRVKYIPLTQPKRGIAQGKYASHHLHVIVPQIGTRYQHSYTADNSSTNHIEIDVSARYIERNQHFDMEYL
jgi:hypothetical protein